MAALFTKRYKMTLISLGVLVIMIVIYTSSTINTLNRYQTLLYMRWGRIVQITKHRLQGSNSLAILLQEYFAAGDQYSKITNQVTSMEKLLRFPSLRDKKQFNALYRDQAKLEKAISAANSVIAADPSFAKQEYVIKLQTYLKSSSVELNKAYKEFFITLGHYNDMFNTRFNQLIASWNDYHSLTHIHVPANITTKPESANNKQGKQ